MRYTSRALLRTFHKSRSPRKVVKYSIAITLPAIKSHWLNIRITISLERTLEGIMAIFQPWTITHSKIASKIRRGTHTRILSTVDIIPHSTHTHTRSRMGTRGRNNEESRPVYLQATENVVRETRWQRQRLVPRAN